MCYLYYNFSGAVKTPSPSKYAGRLAEFIGVNYDGRN
jgi:hypothetical protein